MTTEVRDFQWVKAPWDCHNEVLDMIDWRTVTFHVDADTITPVMSPQDCEVQRDVKDTASGFGGKFGTSISVRVHAKNIPRQCPIIDYATCRRIFEMSVNDKISLASATVKVIGESEFLPRMIERSKSEAADSVRAWFPGCETAVPTNIPDRATVAKRK